MNILESSDIVKRFYQTILDPITMNKKIYIPRIFEPVTLDNLDANDYLTSLPLSLIYDRLFSSIETKQPKNSRVKIRVLSS